MILRRKISFAIITAVALLAAGIIVYVAWFLNIPQQLAGIIFPFDSDEAPTFTITKIAENLSRPWDLGFLPDGTIIFDERTKGISVLETGGKTKFLHKPEDLRAVGEGGMLGLAVDPDFSSNRYIYVCFNVSASEVRLVRFKVNNDVTGLSDREDIVTGMPANSSGRHSGCRPRFGPDGNLWVGTGDAATGTNAQNPQSLGGKILRITSDGAPVAGNMGAPFDSRIYSYGHRNVQGIAFNPEGSKVVGYSIEHGSDRDDEVNELVTGNFGWDPVPGYNESVSMTDKNKYPDAVEAVWRSGFPTIAPSGGTILSNVKWKAWNGALAMAVLKGSHLRILIIENGKLKSEIKELTGFGRLKSAVQGPDGNLYVTSDNGSGDFILRVVPS